MDEKKPSLLLALLGKKKTGGSEEEEPESENIEEDAVRDFFESGKSGDWSGAVDAAKRLIRACSGEDYEDS